MLDIAKNNLGKTLILTFHAAAIRAFWGRISALSAKDVSKNLPFPQNASVSVVYFDGERLIPGEYSHADHLLDL